MENKNQQPTDNLKEAYEAPKCEIIEMQNEGVLCQSGGNGGRYSERDYSDYLY